VKPATPLPWKVAIHPNSGRPSGDIIEPDGTEVATTWAHANKGIRAAERDQNAAYITHAANLHPRLLDTLRSTVRQLEAVPEDVPGWMQRTMLCRRARELAKEAGEEWAMGNGETPDSAISVSINAVLEPSWERLDLGGER